MTAIAIGRAAGSETMDTYGHLFLYTDDLGSQAIAEALASALAEESPLRGYR